ncbi:putative hydrolase [Limihaloglobus sulfuriphilus]|uniref:Putative hydrolase n=1 Tax=Limihaloglobus sulfuriphilus TaxID=1851148 RepID=A0A1R7T645_9BACT|nr:MBL fold metallo-hydrolase [Limihaloglobus sulfuriphilus]AQQ72293.1 putative hydrolase [Limihaloglobus sulfuriphilus]
MDRELKLTLLIEDSPTGGGLISEHGLSFWIESAGTKILFDTGQSGAFIQNAQKLGIDLSSADAIVLSHGHYDHAGGLAEVLKIARNADIYLHPAALKPKFSLKPGGAKFNGMSPEAIEALNGRHIIWTEKPVQISENVSVTGQIPRLTDFEDTGPSFFTGSDCRELDLIPDDQSIFIDTDKGLAVLPGCAHSGVINTLKYISRITGRGRIYAVIGGTHLLRSGRKRINKTIEGLRQYNVEQIYPLHCTGPDAAAIFSREMPGNCMTLATGGSVVF